MISAKLDRKAGILHLQPSGPLEEADFTLLSEVADPYIKQKGSLAGLVVEIDRFPGWKNLAGMMSHFRFVKNHHRKVRRVALVTDARIGKIGAKVAKHFVAAEIKRFPAAQRKEATAWISEVRK